DRFQGARQAQARSQGEGTASRTAAGPNKPAEAAAARQTDHDCCRTKPGTARAETSVRTPTPAGAPEDPRTAATRLLSVAGTQATRLQPRNSGVGASRVTSMARVGRCAAQTGQ